MKTQAFSFCGLMTAAAALCMLTVAPSQAADPKVKLAFGDVNTKSSPVGRSVLHIAELVAKRSGGSLTIDYFERSQLGNERELVDKVKSGTVDMADISTGVLSNFVPGVGVVTLPYLLQSREHGVKVLASDIGAAWVKDFKDKHNVHLLGYFAGSERDLYFRVPVKSAADVKGLKIRVVESPVYVSFVKALGGLPTPVPASEIYSSLQTGVVDGTDIGSATYVTQKIYEQAPHVARIKWLYGYQGIIVSDRSWRRLSPGQQQVLRESAADASRFSVNAYDAYDKTLYTEQARQKLVHISTPDVAQFRKAVQTAYDNEWNAKYGKSLIERIAAMSK